MLSDDAHATAGRRAAAYLHLLLIWLHLLLLLLLHLLLHLLLLLHLQLNLLNSLRLLLLLHLLSLRGGGPAHFSPGSSASMRQVQ